MQPWLIGGMFQFRFVLLCFAGVAIRKVGRRQPDPHLGFSSTAIEPNELGVIPSGL